MSESGESSKESEGVSSFTVEDADDDRFTKLQRLQYGTFSYCRELFSYKKGKLYILIYFLEWLQVLSLNFSKYT